MASIHSVPASDLDADSLASTPRSDIHHHHLHDDGAASLPPRIRFMCSFGGKILPRPHDNQLRYVGGDTRIVAVNRHTTFAALLSRLSKLYGTSNISIKYQLPNEDLDALITVTADEDVENMMEEYDRLNLGHKSSRLRLFLFPIETSNESRASSINSLLDGSAKRRNWFVDALNGGEGAAAAVLERGRSEVSSIVSEVPDYLFGLDNSDDPLKETNKVKNKNIVNDNVSMSDPGSPAPVAPSPYCSTSSSLAPPPDLPPVKTKPVNTLPAAAEQKEGEMLGERMVSQQGGYSGNPMWHHYPNPPVQTMPAVYYVPGSHVQAANASLQTVMRPQFVQSYPVVPGQVPIGYSGVNQVYGGGIRPYEMPGRIITDNGSQGVYYGGRNVAVMQGSYPGMVVPGGEEMQGTAPDAMSGRVSQ